NFPVAQSVATLDSCLLDSYVTSMRKSNATEAVTRFSVSLPAALARELDRMAKEKGYDNRSLAIANMIRANLVEHRQEKGEGEIAGSITLVYDHHRHHLQDLLTDLQHDHSEVIISTLHAHLDHDNCLEILAVRGSASRIKKLADEMI